MTLALFRCLNVDGMLFIFAKEPYFLFLLRGIVPIPLKYPSLKLIQTGRRVLLEGMPHILYLGPQNLRVLCFILLPKPCQHFSLLLPPNYSPIRNGLQRRSSYPSLGASLLLRRDSGNHIIHCGRLLPVARGGHSFQLCLYHCWVWDVGICGAGDGEVRRNLSGNGCICQ